MAFEKNNTVGDIKSQEFKVISENDTVGKALSLFENSVDILIILDQKNNYSGVLVERAILRTDLDPGKSKVKSFRFHPPKVQSTTKVRECARLMIENNILHLPIIDKDNITGVISYMDILKSPVLQKIGRNSVKDFMPDTVAVASPKDKLATIYNKFKKTDISSMPVVEKGNYIGMINLHEIIQAILQHKEKPDYGTKLGEKEHLLDLPIKNILTPPVISAFETETVSEIIDRIISNKLDGISIIDDNNKLLAVITVKDLLKFITGQEMPVIGPKIRINSDVEGLNRTRIKKMVSLFTKKYSSVLSQCEVEIYMRAHREKHKQQRLIYTKVHIHAHRDKFDATAENWGEDYSLRDALEKIEKQVLKKKYTKGHRSRE